MKSKNDYSVFLPSLPPSRRYVRLQCVGESLREAWFERLSTCEAMLPRRLVWGNNNQLLRRGGKKNGNTFQLVFHIPKMADRRHHTAAHRLFDRLLMLKITQSADESMEFYWCLFRIRPGEGRRTRGWEEGVGGDSNNSANLMKKRGRGSGVGQGEQMTAYASGPHRERRARRGVPLSVHLHVYF